MHPKITPEHLGRGAVVYVRQSTMGQVAEHTESQHRQYALAESARSTAGGLFRGGRDRGRVDGGSDVSSEPSFAVEKVNDPSEGHPAERVSRTVRSSVSASTAILGLPDVIAAHTAASHIHAGISRESPGCTSM